MHGDFPLLISLHACITNRIKTQCKRNLDMYFAKVIHDSPTSQATNSISSLEILSKGDSLLDVEIGMEKTAVQSSHRINLSDWAILGVFTGKVVNNLFKLCFRVVLGHRCNTEGTLTIA